MKTFETDDAMEFLLAAREAGTQDEVAALAESLADRVGALEEVPVRAPRPPKKPWLGRGKRPHHPPFLWTDYADRDGRFWSTFFGATFFAVLLAVIPSYIGFGVLGILSGSNVVVPFVIALWPSLLVAMILSMIAAR